MRELTGVTVLLLLLTGLAPQTAAESRGDRCNPMTETCFEECNQEFDACHGEPKCDEQGYCWWPTRDPFDSRWGHPRESVTLHDAELDPAIVKLQFCDGRTQVLRNPGPLREFRGTGSYRDAKIKSAMADWDNLENGPYPYYSPEQEC